MQVYPWDDSFSTSPRMATSLFFSTSTSASMPQKMWQKRQNVFFVSIIFAPSKKTMQQPLFLASLDKGLYQFHACVNRFLVGPSHLHGNRFGRTLGYAE